jgi:hypothetical protein
MQVPLPADCAARYEPERLLASGGFGDVYVARQRGLDRPVALKALRTDVLGDDVEVARFLDEARITASLSHPHVVRILDHGAAGGVPWIAYEYLEGPTLRERLSRGPLVPAEAVDVALQIASALAEAHARDVLHRDIKPENVISDGAGSYKVADFGIAKWTGHGAVHTRTGFVLGTPAYLAPELIGGEAASPLSDLYALGVVLFELLTGDTPFRSGSAVEIMDQHLNARVPLPSERSAAVPHELDAVVDRTLSKRPRDRFASAAQLHDVLLRLHDRMTAPGRRPETAGGHSGPESGRPGDGAATAPALARGRDPGGAPTRATAAARGPGAEVELGSSLNAVMALTQLLECGDREAMIRLYRRHPDLLDAYGTAAIHLRGAGVDHERIRALCARHLGPQSTDPAHFWNAAAGSLATPYGERIAGQLLAELDAALPGAALPPAARALFRSRLDRHAEALADLEVACARPGPPVPPDWIAEILLRPILMAHLGEPLDPRLRKRLIGSPLARRDPTLYRLVELVSQGNLAAAASIAAPIVARAPAVVPYALIVLCNARVSAAPVAPGGRTPPPPWLLRIRTAHGLRPPSGAIRARSPVDRCAACARHLRAGRHATRLAPGCLRRRLHARRRPTRAQTRRAARRGDRVRARLS